MCRPHELRPQAVALVATASCPQLAEVTGLVVQALARDVGRGR